MELRGHHCEGVELPQCRAVGRVSATRAADLPRLAATRPDLRAVGADSSSARLELLITSLRRTLATAVPSAACAHLPSNAVRRTVPPRRDCGRAGGGYAGQQIDNNLFIDILYSRGFQPVVRKTFQGVGGRPFLNPIFMLIYLKMGSKGVEKLLILLQGV